MKIERTKNATRSMVFGCIQTIYSILSPFIMRTIMLYFMGVEYLGLNSLFTSILQVLNLAELGVGSAMVYSMYKPIVDDDQDKICALMYMYRKYYRIIGLIIAAAGMVLLPFIPNLIKNSDQLPSELNIYILYLLNLGATVLTYWLFAYKNALLSAHQRRDVISKVTLSVNVALFVIQLVVILCFRNYYVYLIAALVFQIINNIVTAVITTKMYPKYKPVGRLKKEEVADINRRIRDLFTSKVGSVIVNYADTIVISAFLGLKLLAMYQNYFYIISSVMSIFNVIFMSLTPGVGNSLIVETKEKNFNDLNKLTFIISWLSGFCACCFACLYQPFMEIWVGKDLLLGFSAVICFCIYFFVMEINRVLNMYKDSGGLWHEDRWRPLVTALSNFVMNIIMVQFWGIYGVLLSTVLAAVFIGMPWLLKNLFTVMFQKEMLKPYLKKLFVYVVTSSVTVAVCIALCSFIEVSNLWIVLLVRAVVCVIVPNVIFFLVYSKTKVFKDAVELINNMTKGKIKFLNHFI